MKNYLISSVISNLCNSPYLKLFIGLSWFSIIGAAGYYGFLLETYLITMLIAYGAYLVCNIYSPKNSTREANLKTRLGYSPPKENYLEVFMPTNHKD